MRKIIILLAFLRQILYNNDMIDIKSIIGKNLTRLRLEKNWTQNDVAEKLNYSDKSVSKWEHGDAMPPIEVLVDISNLYNVSLDYIVSENFDDDNDRRYNAKENNSSKLVITLLSISLIWLLATVIYVYGVMLSQRYELWKLFVGALPISCIDLLVFNGIWGKRKNTFILCSILVWTTLATIYIIFLENNPWLIFIVGVPLQIGIILWSQLKVTRSKKNRIN